MRISSLTEATASMGTLCHNYYRCSTILYWKRFPTDRPILKKLLNITQKTPMLLEGNFLPKTLPVGRTTGTTVADMPCGMTHLLLRKCILLSRRCMLLSGNLRSLTSINSLAIPTRAMSSNSKSLLMLDGSPGKPKNDDDSNDNKMSYGDARKTGLISSRYSMSPGERVGKMLEADGTWVKSDSQEGNAANTDSTADMHTSPEDTKTSLSNSESAGPLQSTTVPDPPMIDGEIVFVTRENNKRHENMYRMFKLIANNVLRTKYGSINHADIIGHLAGTTFTTDLGLDVMIRRPCLDEFVLYMKRTPVISYPKDCCTMLMMIDASPGDVILEAGTGSGAMTIFLSRAVGSSGCVHSFDCKPEHQRRARANVKHWAASWDLSHPHNPWPDNVCYYPGKLESTSSALGSSLLVDGAVLDMERPHLVMSVIAARLKAGRAAVVYVANITQIIDLAEYLRIQKLPLTIEKIIDVSHTVWVVMQARRHSGPVRDNLSTTRKAVDNELFDDDDDGNYPDEDSWSSSNIEECIPKYIAKPRNKQPGHTAFLVKLRKIDNPSATYKI